MLYIHMQKDTVSNNLTKINGWDQNLNFTVEKIKLFDSNIFLQSIIIFKKNSKKH
jgi:hypothetical protein